MVALGEMGDVALMGEQMSFALRGEILERIPPFTSAGHRVDGVGTRDGIGLVVRDRLPWARRFSDPFAAAVFARLKNGAGISMAMGSA